MSLNLSSLMKPSMFYLMKPSMFYLWKLRNRQVRHSLINVITAKFPSSIQILGVYRNIKNGLLLLESIEMSFKLISQLRTQFGGNSFTHTNATPVTPLLFCKLSCSRQERLKGGGLILILSSVNKIPLLVKVYVWNIVRSFLGVKLGL
jgi:hypothetical protein